MKETHADLEELQRLLTGSMDRAGGFLRSSFGIPDHSLSAPQLTRYLHGVLTVALASVTAKGEPRVAPTGALFWRGRFCIPTTASAARTRHVAARPAVSLTHYSGNELAVIVHGRAYPVTPEHPDFDALEGLHREVGGGSALDWGEGVYLVVDADVMYTYARHPGRYRE